MFQFIARLILKNRPVVIVIVSIITLVMGYKATQLKMLYEPASLLPATDSVQINYEKFAKKFGAAGNAVFIGVSDSSFFSYNHYNDWRDLEQSLKLIHGVIGAFSIYDIYTLKKNSEEKKFDLEKIISGAVDNQGQLDSIQQTIFNLPFYKGFLYNDTTSTYIMVVSLDKKILQSAQRVVLLKEIVKKIGFYEHHSGISTHISGLPYIRITMAEMVKSEMFFFIFLAIAVTAFILYLFFRSFKVVFFSLVVVGVSVVWAMGTLAFFGYPVTILTAVIPPLIIVIGIPNCVFLLNKYHQEYRYHGNKIKALQRVIQKVGSAAFMTNLTTAAGFGTFVIAGTEILREFGLVASVNIIGVFIVSITLIPVIFSFLPPPTDRHLKHLENRYMRKVTKFIVDITFYHRKIVFGITAVLILVGVIGLSLVRSNGYMVDDVPHNHKVYQDLKFFESNFSGLMPFEILIDAQRPKGLMQYENLRRINELQNKLKVYPQLSKPLSIVEAIKFVRQGYYNGQVSSYSFPISMEMGFLMTYIPRGKSDNPLFNNFVDSSGRYARIMYNVADVGTQKMNVLLDSISQDIRSVYHGKANLVSITGGSVVNAKGSEYLVHNLISSLILAVMLIAIFMASMFQSTKMVFFALISNLIPLLLTAAFMGYFGISLKPSTVLVFSIAFGISVDNSIHFLAKYKQEMLLSGQNIGESVRFAIRETGVSMLYTSIILFFGFGIFVASSFGGTVALGVLISFTLLIAMFSNLIVLPTLLLTLEKFKKKKFFSDPLISIYNEEIDIELSELRIKDDIDNQKL
jgi:Predicted exporters of the RND superfamily